MQRLVVSCFLLALAVGFALVVRQVLFSAEDPKPPDFSQPQSPILPGGDSATDPDSAFETEVEAALEYDNAQPRFSGKIGDFTVTPGELTQKSACPDSAESELSSEKISTALDNNLDVGPCSLQGGLDDGTIIIRSFYEGEFSVPFEAPKERLTVLTINGHRAIGESEASKVSSARLLVVEREATEDAAGMVLELLVPAHAGGLDRAIELAETVSK